MGRWNKKKPYMVILQGEVVHLQLFMPILQVKNGSGQKETNLAKAIFLPMQKQKKLFDNFSLKDPCFLGGKMEPMLSQNAKRKQLQVPS